MDRSIAIIIFAIEQNTTSGMNDTSLPVISEKAAFSVPSALRRPGFELERMAAAMPSIAAMKISCSMSDFWKGVMMSVGTMPTSVSRSEIVTPSPLAMVALAASVTAEASEGLPIGNTR